MSDSIPAPAPNPDDRVASPAPGWYKDPKMADTRRYWDGQTWSDHVAPAAAAQPRDDSGLVAAGWICVFVLPPAAIVLGVMLDKRGGHNRASAAITVLGLIFTLLVGLYIWSVASAPDYSSYDYSNY